MFSKANPMIVKAKEVFRNFKSEEKIVEEINDSVQILVEKIYKERRKIKELQEFNRDEEIEKLKEELSSLRKRSLVILSHKEQEEFQKFRREHYDKCKGNPRFILEGTGIGTSVEVQCKKCGAIKDITDYSNF